MPELYTRFSTALKGGSEIFPLFPQVALRISLGFLEFPKQKILDRLCSDRCLMWLRGSRLA
jgi:hypothetical protein